MKDHLRAEIGMKCVTGRRTLFCDVGETEGELICDVYSGGSCMAPRPVI